MAGNQGHSNSPVLNASSGAGHVTNIGGLNSYVTASPLAILAILLVSDVFGIQLITFQKLTTLVFCLYNLLKFLTLNSLLIT